MIMSEIELIMNKAVELNKKMNEVVELNEKIKARIEELGLEEFHFSEFYGSGECDWRDEEIDTDISFDNDVYDYYELGLDFRYWDAGIPIKCEVIRVDLRAIKIVRETILYCFEMYCDADKGRYNEEANFLEFEELLDMDYYNDYNNIKPLLERILRGLTEEGYFKLIKANKEYFRKEINE